MEIKFIISLFVFVSVLNLGLATQNLCNDAKAKGFDFAADPSHCTRYLYCHRDPENSDDKTNIISVFYRQCDQTGTHKYFKDGMCVSDATHCVEPLDICPGGATSKVKTANYNEANCNEFRYCALVTSAFSKCLPTADETWQFDRNSGQCVDNTGGKFLPDCPFFDANAPTTPAPPTFSCATKPDGYYNSGASDNMACDDWVYCYAEDIWDYGSCPCGQEFNDVNSPCKLSTTSVEGQHCSFDLTTVGECPCAACPCVEDACPCNPDPPATETDDCPCDTCAASFSSFFSHWVPESARFNF